MLGEKFLQVRLDTVLDQTGVDTEFVARIVVDLFESDAQLLACLVGDHPQGLGVLDGLLLEPAGWAHPVQGLVGTVVGVDTHRTVGFDEEETSGRRQMSRQASDVVHTATGNHKTHTATLEDPLD